MRKSPGARISATTAKMTVDSVKARNVTAKRIDALEHVAEIDVTKRLRQREHQDKQRTGKGGHAVISLPRK